MDSVQQIKAFLIGALPESHGSIDDFTASRMASVMQEHYHPAYGQAFGLQPPISHSTSGSYPVRSPAPAWVKFLMVEATHSRITGKAQHSFTGVLPMIQVDLPHEHHHVIVDTQLGQLVDGDLLLYDMPTFNKYYAQHFGFTADRVVIVSPPRYGGARFGAVLYGWAYKQRTDKIPTAMFMAAGMATGATRVLYSSKDIRTPIVGHTGYSPTPFSSPDNTYRGSLDFDANGKVGSFWIDVRGSAESEPHFTLRATVTEVPEAHAVDPHMLLLQAALRVCTIAHSMGKEVPGLGPFTNLLAPLGELYPWHTKPH